MEFSLSLAKACPEAKPKDLVLLKAVSIDLLDKVIIFTITYPYDST
jgi:hypothetical protein